MAKRILPMPAPRPKLIITTGPPLSHSFTSRTLKKKRASQTVIVTIEGQEPVTMTVPRKPGQTQTQAHKLAFASAKVKLKIT